MTQNVDVRPLKRSHWRLVSVVTALAFCFVSTGCFNTYSLEREEFAKLQRADAVPAVVKSKGGENVAVDRDTALFVRSVGGRRYPVTAFNFKLTESQLVASDRDTLLMTSELQSYEVDHLSTWKTVLLITAGALAAAGVIVGVVVSAGDKASFQN